MLALPDEGPTYLIIDAVDECPDASGIPSPRERVLQFVEELVNLSLLRLYICVTSRPEIDIRNILEPLTSCRVSLHDQSGQKQDIENYVRSVVYSDSEPIMRRWRKEDKDLVIETLTERADGMFRWVFCQLDILRHCLPSSVRRTLDELPESLDETYERVLKEIKKSNREHARRLLHCLVVAVRPLRLEELSEIIAFDFNDAEEIPKLNPSWRWEDHEQALLSSCSSLIAIVDANDTRVVQFSHFSVKEFLTSPRLGTSSGDISHYHTDLELAHTIFARACLSILLQLDNHDGEESSDWHRFPLAKYAAEHWVFHAQYKDVSMHLRKGMEGLFNPEKPHFSAWRRLHDIDTTPKSDSIFYIFYPDLVSPAFPLYYAALCGFHDLSKDLISRYPLQVNANGGFYASPLVAALAGKHFRTADLLRLSGAHPDVRGNLLKTPLHGVAYHGDLEILHKLIEYNADLNAADVDGYTPLYQASKSWRLPRAVDAARLFLEHGVDVNVRTNHGATALHGGSAEGSLEMVRMLLEHGADVEVKNDQGKTPHQLALAGSHHEITKLLSEYGPKGTS